MMDSYGGGWGVGMVVMGLFWVVVVGAIVWAAVRLTNRPHQAAPPTVELPRQILDRRFAAGELDEQQYVEARRLLDSDTTGTSR